MIHISDKTLGIWFIDVDKSHNLLMVLESIGDTKYRLTHRHRYTLQNKSSWYTGVRQFNKPEDAVAMVQNVFHVASRIAHGDKYEVLRGELSCEEFKERLLASPFINIIEKGSLQ